MLFLHTQIKPILSDKLLYEKPFKVRELDIRQLETCIQEFIENDKIYISGLIYTLTLSIHNIDSDPRPQRLAFFYERPDEDDFKENIFAFVDANPVFNKDLKYHHPCEDRLDLTIFLYGVINNVIKEYNNAPYTIYFDNVCILVQIRKLLPNDSDEEKIFGPIP